MVLLCVWKPNFESNDQLEEERHANTIKAYCLIVSSSVPIGGNCCILSALNLTVTIKITIGPNWQCAMLLVLSLVVCRPLALPVHTVSGRPVS